MTKVLAVIDDSAVASRVLAAAAMLAALLDATPEALHVREDHLGHARDAAKTARVALREVRGDVVDEIAAAADATDVAMVVIGARSTAKGHELAGHIALELMTRITKPLVVVPPNMRQRAAFRRMAVPLDGTSETAACVKPAMELAAAAGIEVIVIHVSDEVQLPPFTEQPQHETRAFAEEFVARFAPGIPVRLELRVGLPPAEVLDTAIALDADLCVLAWGQVLGPDRARVIKELLTRCQIPLLLFPKTLITTLG